MICAKVEEDDDYERIRRVEKTVRMRGSSLKQQQSESKDAKRQEEKITDSLVMFHWIDWRLLVHISCKRQPASDCNDCALDFEGTAGNHQPQPPSLCLAAASVVQVLRHVGHKRESG